jgi:pimeloyl-ACP methyl ester carboxylesterase
MLTGLLLLVSLAAEAEPRVEVQSRFANVNRTRIHYLIAGHGAPVLLLHGYTQTSHMWLPLIDVLAKTNTVIAPDLRGAGQSDTPESGYDKKTLASDVHALVQSLGHERVILVGHDIGLMVAYAYAAQFPGEVERIALMDAFLPGVGNWKDVWLLRDLWHFHFYGEVPLKLVDGRERIYFEHFWNDFAADRNHSVPEADRKLYAAAYARPGGMRAGFAYFEAFPQDAVDFEVFSKSKLAIPMLVLTGGKGSGPFLIEQGRLVADDVRGVVIEGSGHWLMEEAPDQVIPLLVEFVTGKPVSGRSLPSPAR